MPIPRPRRADLAAMLRLAAPVVTVQVGMMMLGVVDTMVVGRLSSEALAAVALGHLAVVAVSSFGIGLLLTLDPLVSQAVGARDSGAVRRAVQRGMVLAFGLMAPTAMLLLPAEAIFTFFRQPPETVPIAAAYVRICIPGLLTYYAFFVLRLTLQAMERMRPVVVTIVAVNLFNLAADWGLVFGVGPLPALGAIGSAWASTAARILLFVLLLTLSRRETWPLLRRLDPAVLRWKPLWNTLRLGVPIGFQLQLEIVAFAVIGLLMGGLGTLQMAAHQVAINLASLTFMVPLGVASATAVRVGHAIGSGSSEAARRAAVTGLLVGAGFMTTTAALFIGLPELLARAYTSVEEVVAMAALLIPIAGYFQIVDGLQVVSAGVLRGAGDTRAPLAANLAGFWLIGLPISLTLAFRLGYGPQGLWWGLVAGLSAVACFMLLRVVWKLSGEIRRVEVE